MRYNEFKLDEKRSHRINNPKRSINARIMNRFNQTTEEIAPGVKNLFVSFTQIEKLGINPKSKYNTPLGIYSYPASFVAKLVGWYQPMKVLPFAGTAPYVNLFSVNTSYGAIIEASKLQDETPYYEKIGQYLNETLPNNKNNKEGFSKDDYLWEFQDRIDRAKSEAKQPEYPMGRLWYVMYYTSQLIADSQRKRSRSNPVMWNHLFRKIGIAGVIDSEGLGIIHESEPTQAVFFDPRVIVNNERIENKYSPDSVEDAKAKGQSTKDSARFFGSMLNKMSVSEIIEWTDLHGFRGLEYLKVPELRMAVMKKHPSLITYLRNPTYDEQVIALTKDISTAGNIEKLDTNALLYALQHIPDTSAEDMTRFLVKKVFVDNVPQHLIRPLLSVAPLLVMDIQTIGGKDFQYAYTQALKKYGGVGKGDNYDYNLWWRFAKANNFPEPQPAPPGWKPQHGEF